MGLFSRKEAAVKTTRSSSDDQLIELRNRARRRLIGAVVLVLAAIVLIPILISDKSTQEPEQVVSVIPSIIPPSEEKYRLAESLEQPVFEQEIDNTEDPGLIETPVTVSEPEPTVLPPSVEPVAQAKPEPKPEPKPKPAPVRTDDGAVALALLEGRTPPKTTSAPTMQQGAVVVQIGAYSSQSDANARRAKLVAAGVSNAYVETATVSGKPAYRLRVGPFPSRQAAQAAQARLRSLGYENSFISSK